MSWSCGRRAVAVAVVALVAAGCTGSSGSTATDSVLSPASESSAPSVAASPEPSASASVSASPAASAGGEDAASILAEARALSMPRGYAITFDPEIASDPAIGTVLAVSELIWRAQVSAVDAGVMDDLLLRHRVSGRASLEVADLLKSVVGKGYTFTGKNILTKRVATVRGGKATVIYCFDQSKGFLKSRKTGKVVLTPVTASSFLRYTELYAKTGGVWRLTVYSAVADAGCRA